MNVFVCIYMFHCQNNDLRNFRSFFDNTKMTKMIMFCSQMHKNQENV